MWRFLRNRRLLLCLHTIFRALIYWAHRTVVWAIAWHLVFKNAIVACILVVSVLVFCANCDTTGVFCSFETGSFSFIKNVYFICWCWTSCVLGVALPVFAIVSYVMDDINVNFHFVLLHFSLSVPYLNWFNILVLLGVHCFDGFLLGQFLGSLPFLPFIHKYQSSVLRNFRSLVKNEVLIFNAGFVYMKVVENQPNGLHMFDLCTCFCPLYTLSVSPIRLSTTWVNYIVIKYSQITITVLDVFGKCFW